MNQGEFFVYSPDGGITGIDTIKVREGRFEYETPMREPSTLVLIFPNYSEQPVFAEPGATAVIKGDASHLKEMTIAGTDNNELMTRARMEIARQSPPDVPKVVEAFIKEQPVSPVSTYLLQRYFVLDRQYADYEKALTLTKLILKENPEDGRLLRLKKQLEALKAMKDKQLPKFTATDVEGKKVTEAKLKARVNVVTAWASWSYKSNDMQRRLKQKKDKYGDTLSIVSICLDGRPDDCKQQVVTRDSLKWPTICDGRMWQTPLMKTFSFVNVPANLIIDQKGRILERNLSPQELEEKIEKLLKKKD